MVRIAFPTIESVQMQRAIDTCKNINITFQNGDSYLSTITPGEDIRVGIYHLNNGDLYKGSFRNRVFNGKRLLNSSLTGNIVNKKRINVNLETISQEKKLTSPIKCKNLAIKTLKIKTNNSLKDLKNESSIKVDRDYQFTLRSLRKTKRHSRLAKRSVRRSMKAIAADRLSCSNIADSEPCLRRVSTMIKTIESARGYF